MLIKDDLRVKGEQVWQSKPNMPKHTKEWRCLRVLHLARFLRRSYKRAALFLWAWQLLLPQTVNSLTDYGAQRRTETGQGQVTEKERGRWGEGDQKVRNEPGNSVCV